MQQADALSDMPRAAYWELVEDKPLFIVVWGLLPSVRSKEDARHVRFLVGYAVHAAEKATGRMYCFSKKAKGWYIFSNTDRVYISNVSFIFFQVSGISIFFSLSESSDMNTDDYRCAKFYFYYEISITVDILL